MKPFSERNPIAVGVVGLTLVAAVGVATFYAQDLPLIGGGTTYTADFTDAGGLREGDDVRIAGVKVGDVDTIDLAGAHVRVEFTVQDAWIGNASRVDIKIKSMLGQEYLDVDPLGDRSQDPSTSIPTSRTSTPVDVNAAISKLASTVGSIDTAQLGTSFDTLAAAFRNTPGSVRTALSGLTRLSQTIADRDAALKQLAAEASSVTGTVASSNEHFAKLIQDGALLLQELQARSAAITALLDGTRRLADQLAGLVHDNTKVLHPALVQLDRVTSILLANRGNLDQALRLIGPYYSLLTNATGNGRWLDSYLCGLFSNGAPVLDANANRDCAPRGVK